MIYRLGVDVGGTFTDFAIHNAVTGELTIGKTLTSSADPSMAVLEGLHRLTEQIGITAAELGQAIHATTIATNAVIQRRGAVTALVTTQGFRDVLRIGRQKRWDLYDNMTDKPEPLVPRHLIWEVPERVLYDGSVHKPLDRRAMRRVATEINKAGVRSVAVCFIHSYANAAHERRAAAIVKEVAPRVLVTLSSDVAPLIREYERSNTTVVNAYLMPLIRDYIRRIRQGLRQRGFRQDLFIMQSNGGLATSRVVDRYPIRIIESGPAAGVLTAAKFAGAAGTRNLLSFDMGGTTAKMCLIEDGRATKTGMFEIDMINLKKHSGLPLSIPAIDLVEIGTGGGSVASARMSAIAVGPESAGADPGPICYGRGGKQPTVTDADLVLGYLNENYFLGGEMSLDAGGAREGIEEKVGRPLGIDLIEAAWGIHEVANYQMARAARAVSVAKGKDPRNFVLVAFGGAGPVHGARLARILGCPKVVFPVKAGVESAIGLLMAEPAFDVARTRIIRLDAENVKEINQLYTGLEREGRKQLRMSGVAGNVKFSRSAEMRFVGQGFELTVDLPPREYRATDIASLRQAFFDVYTATYGGGAFDKSDAIEVVHWRLTALCPISELKLGAIDHGDGDATRALKGSRPVYFPERRGFRECPVYDRYALRAGDRIEGPAIVEERESTLVLIPSSTGITDDFGNVVVELRDVDAPKVHA